jgi:hypothetical protein
MLTNHIYPYPNNVDIHTLPFIPSDGEVLVIRTLSAGLVGLGNALEGEPMAPWGEGTGAMGSIAIDIDPPLSRKKQSEVL